MAFQLNAKVPWLNVFSAKIGHLNPLRILRLGSFAWLYPFCSSMLVGQSTNMVLADLLRHIY
jgi:hypothetical protein